jgi:transglutaminase-like putative cysteine protease
MKLKRIFITSVIVSNALLFNLFARDISNPQYGNSEMAAASKMEYGLSVRCKLSYTISVPGNTRFIRLTAVVPESVPNIQKINRVEYSKGPERFFSKNGYRYAEFLINKPARMEKLTVTIYADLYRYDLNTAMNNKDKNQFQDTGLEEFLKEETYIEKNDREMREIANSIVGNSQIDLVRNIYNYVLDNMEYVIQGKKDRGALNAMRYKKGDCSEYSDLFVAICRASKIPARVVTGISVQTDAKTAKHNWTEVYLNDYGWVPFDPSKGDVKITALKDRIFNTLEPAYIYFSHIRNDEILKDFHYCSFTYFGDAISVDDSVDFELIRPLEQDSASAQKNISK